MAELIGTISAVSSLIEISGKILTIGYGYLSKVTRAPTEMRTLLSEVASLNLVLDRLHILTLDEDNNPLARSTLQSLERSKCFATSERLLEAVQNSIKTCEQQDEQDIKNFGKKLFWPFKEKETKETILQLNGLRETFSAALAVDSAVALRRLEETESKIYSSVTAIKEFANAETETARAQHLKKWLCPVYSNPEEDFEAALQLRYQETGQWLLNSDDVMDWLQTSNGFLWLHGIPGSGKTVLTTIMIEELLQRTSEQGEGVVFFYCEHGNPKKRVVRDFLATSAMQLLRARSNGLKDVETLFKSKNEDNNRKLTVSEYTRLIRTMSLSFDKVFVVVDALDECSEPESFAQAFQQLLRLEQGCTINVMVTSRTDVGLERLLSPLATSRLCLEGLERTDIRECIDGDTKSRIRSEKLKLRNLALADQIVDTLVARADGLFLQAKLQLEYVCAMKSDRAIKAALANLPHGLDETYDRILEEIIVKHPGSLGLIKTILQWLMQSVVVLTLDQLAYAVSIQPEDTRLDLENIVTDSEDLAALCGSLIVVDKSSGVSMIRLAHLSVQEYLCSDRLARNKLRFFHTNPAKANLEIGLTCIRYIGFADFADPKLTMSSAPVAAQYQLLDYAATHWASHMKKACVASDVFHEQVAPCLTWFLRPGTQGDQYSTWHEFIAYKFCGLQGRQPPLYFTIVFGLEAAFDMLLSEFEDVNRQFECGWTPLTAAVMAGEKGMARTLLRAGADVISPAASNGLCKGLTALHIAAEKADQDMVSLLLASKASPHARSYSESTPLYRAARSGSVAVLKMLYDAGADIDASTYDDWTPLSEAVIGGHLDVLRLLLHWGAHPSIADADGHTPLDRASWAGFTEIERELEKAITTQLTTQPNPLVPVRQGQTQTIDAPP